MFVLHESVVEPPTVTVFGDAVRLEIEAGGVGVSTATDADVGALVPPGPVHVKV